VNETRIGGYVIRHAGNGWNLYLTSTGEYLRTFTSHHGACIAAERYERMTANLSA
jgi:hypothetical protein